MCLGCFRSQAVNVTSPVPPAMSNISVSLVMGDLSISVRSQLRYWPKLESLLKRSYFQAISVKIFFTRAEEISAGAS